MDRQDKQDLRELHHGLTHLIIGCAFEVVNELGSGFLESVYENAMMIALSDARVSTETQTRLEVKFREKLVGEFYADMIVENKVLVEFNAVKELAPEHEAQVNQLPEGNRHSGWIAH